MASKSTKTSRKSSIASKFNQSLLTLFLILSLALIPVVYYLTKVQAMNQANKELTLLGDMIKSIRNVVREDTRPHFTPKGEFYPVVVSSTVMAKTVASKFARLRPEYYIKIFAENPLNLEDLPEPLEAELLARFRQDSELKSVVQTGIIKGKQYLLASAPAKVKQGCLLCHGNPDLAPLAISKTYGKDSGYGWKVGEIVGGSAVGVPLANINSLAISRTLYALLALALVFGVLYVYLNAIVRKNIITPISEISAKAHKIAKGDLGEAVKTDRDDEIGDLANSFEMMRRSFITLVRRIKG